MYPLHGHAGASMATMQTPASGKARPRDRGLAGTWLFALIWLGVCAAAGMGMFNKGSDTLGRMMLGLFTALGLGMLFKAWRQTRLAARHQGAELQCDPPQPRGGQTLQVQLRSPHVRVGDTATLRLAEYRIDDSDSTTRTRLAWEQRREARPLGTPPACWLQAQFELPAEAAAHDSRRGDERVSWRIEWLDADGEPELSFDLAVQAGPGVVGEPADRWAPRAVAPAPPDARLGTASTVLPEIVDCREDAGGVEWRFRRRGWRILALCAGVAALVAVSLAWHHGQQQHDRGVALAHWAAGALLLAAALHAASLRWYLHVGDDGARVDRGSWLWPRLLTLPLAALGRLQTELAYTVSTSGNTVEYHRVRVTEGSPLTPGLATRAAAEGLARRLAQAAQDRGPRFAPGHTRGAAGPGLGPGIQMLLAWAGWAVVVGLAALALRG